jgi:DNA-binding NarL/FixJ family response regulator
MINKEVKVLLSSGYAEENILSAFGDRRPSGFIQKPYKPDALLDRVQRLLADGGTDSRRPGGERLKP